MSHEPCQRCGGSGWITTPNALCTDNKTRTVRCKCPVCNHGNAERENDCARAVDEFIQSHHNPIVAGKNAEISAMASRLATIEADKIAAHEVIRLLREECRKARAILLADGKEAFDTIAEDRFMYRDARAATDAAGAMDNIAPTL